jgi:hypothetical protein
LIHLWIKGSFFKFAVGEAAVNRITKNRSKNVGGSLAIEFEEEFIFSLLFSCIIETNVANLWEGI